MIILTPEGHLVWCLLRSCIVQQMYLYPSIYTYVHTYFAGNKEQEELLMQEWFGLLNKKNELIKRQIELNILYVNDIVAMSEGIACILLTCLTMNV